MKKIIEYAAVTYVTGMSESMDDMVNRKIEEGFQPYGFPVTAGASAQDDDKHQQSDFIIVQAMVKYDE